MACSEWFKQIGLGKPWNLDRMMITCNLLGLNVWQLGALCGVRRNEIRLMLAKDRIPVALCLHFKMLENWFFEVKLKRKIDGTVIPAHFVGQEQKIAEIWAMKEESDAKANDFTAKKRLRWKLSMDARERAMKYFQKQEKKDSPWDRKFSLAYDAAKHFKAL